MVSIFKSADRICSFTLICLSLALMLCGNVSSAVPTGASVGDAYFRTVIGGQKWAIGTQAVEMVLQCKGGKLQISSLKNKLMQPVREYVPRDGAVDLMMIGDKQFVERYNIKNLWQKTLTGGAVIDPAADGIKIAVKKGDMIGFAVGPHGSYGFDQTEWITTVDYGDGDKYISTQDPKVNQGPIWFYCVNVPNTGFMEEMDSVEWSTNIKEDIRIPSEKSGNRAPGMAPHVGSTVMHPSNECDAVRVWCAPKDGTVTVSGAAKSVGGGDVDLKVLSISEKSNNAGSEGGSTDWKLVSCVGRNVVEGGRPAVKLEAILQCYDTKIHYFVIAYPGTSILRQWAVLENTGNSAYGLKSYSGIFSMSLDGKDAGSYTHYWMNNLGENAQEQWKMKSATVSDAYSKEIGTTATIQYVPWMALRNNNGSKDGLFVTLDYMGDWRLKLSREGNGPMVLSGTTSFQGQSVQPGGRYQLPYVTLGVFHNDLDDMERRAFDWQYAYLWDYTHDDWFGLMQFTTAWWAYSQNLNEQFAGRLAYLNMDWSDYLRTAGMEVLWDDAGWAANPDIWFGNREGPDFAQTLRFLPKMGMKWCLWFPGDPTSGIMDTKVGSWGDFQWRTDGLPLSGSFDQPFRKEVTDFLKDHPRSSWQTCTGGSTYAHTFDWQRYGDVHYDTDAPGNDVTNYYLSYLELPDKWFDNLATWAPGKGIVFDPYTGRRMLTQAPKWGLYITPEQLEQMAPIADLYHYLLKEGVAGRWSYMPHIRVKGDDEYHYGQRINYSRTKSIIILKHKAPDDVTVYPQGLLPDYKYLVEWDSGRPSSVRTGKDLMTNGILISNQAPGELIYLNLPRRPRSGSDKVPPQPPTRVVFRQEMNIGFTGVGIYWSPGSDNNWISSYEVRRGEQYLGKVGVGTYFFDRSSGWDPKAVYSVRTVDGDGNVSDWVSATPIVGETLAYSVLGAHFPESGRNGWSAETTADCASFEPMKWIPAERPPSADLGGTPNQRGGAEGYWEGANTARVARGWQQASTEAMSVRTWTAPRAGEVRITGRAMKEYFHNTRGGALRIKIMQGTTKVWPADADWATAQVGDLTGVTQDITLKVAKGDAIRFVLNKSASPDDDLLGWMPMIAYADEKLAVQPQSVVRILCGSKTSYTDGSGNVWSADKYFVGGKPITSSAKINGTLPTAKDQALYNHGRAGKEFTYSIPVKPGLYAIRLKFAEPKYDYFFQRPFSMDINGRRVMTNVDICQAARGSKKAYEREFRYMVPNGDGKLVLKFTGGWEPMMKSSEAMVQAIEVLPEVKPSIRIDCGSDSEFIDWAGWTWSADSGFAGGQVIKSDSAVDQASPTLYDQGLYRTACSGKTINYSFSLPAGLYTVHLKFAELWLKEIGKRPMDIEINGRTFWKSFDPSKIAGKLGMTSDIRADDITPDKNGKISIKIKAAGANDAILQGIEVE